MERIPDRYKLDPDLWESVETTDVPADFTLNYADLVKVDGVLTEVD
jgi:hypothetical protein